MEGEDIVLCLSSLLKVEEGVIGPFKDGLNHGQRWREGGTEIYLSTQMSSTHHCIVSCWNNAYRNKPSSTTAIKMTCTCPPLPPPKIFSCVMVQIGGGSNKIVTRGTNTNTNYVRKSVTILSFPFLTQNLWYFIFDVKIIYFVTAASWTSSMVHMPITCAPDIGHAGWMQ